MSKRFRMFAGPNGSGKTSLISQIEKEYNLGYFINADIVEERLNTAKFLDVTEYLSVDLSQKDWDDFISDYDFSHTQSKTFPKLEFSENILVVEEEINSYQASIICAFFRLKSLHSTDNFSFETVMSHPSKVEFFKQTKEKGFKTYLYFICTQDPEINVLRVKNRTVKGGHDVPKDKIIDRYYRSLELLSDVFKVADRAFILDSSNKSRDVILEKNGKNIYLHSSVVPEWVQTYLLQKLNLK